MFGFCLLRNVQNVIKPLICWFGFLETAESGSTCTLASSTSSTAKFVIQAPVSFANGEEDKDCVYDVRASYSNLPQSLPTKRKRTKSKPNSSSVPSTAGRIELKKGDEKKVNCLYIGSESCYTIQLCFHIHFDTLIRKF